MGPLPAGLNSTYQMPQSDPSLTKASNSMSDTTTFKSPISSPEIGNCNHMFPIIIHAVEEMSETVDYSET